MHAAFVSGEVARKRSSFSSLLQPRRNDMADWSIKIVPATSGPGAAFQPDLQGYGPGDPLPAQQDDLVTWGNWTDDTHQPWPTDSDYNPLPETQVLPRGSANYLSDPIPPGESSRPSYDVALP